jgi:hypothetical protein
MTDTTAAAETTTETKPKRFRTTPAAMVVANLADAVKGAKAILGKDGLPDDIKATVTAIAAINPESIEHAKLAAFRMSSIRQSRPAGPPLEAGDSVRFEDADTASLYGASADSDFTVESVTLLGRNEDGKGGRYFATLVTPNGKQVVPASLLTLND